MSGRLVALPFLSLLSFCAFAQQASAQKLNTMPTTVTVPTQISPALGNRANDLIGLINGQTDPKQIFAADALAQIPPDRFRAMAAAIRSKYGRAVAIDRIEGISAHSGTVIIVLEKTRFSVKLSVEPDEPHLIYEMLLQ